MRKIISTIIILGLSYCSFSQDKETKLNQTDEAAKAILLFYVSNLINWPNSDTLSNFRIGVQSRTASFTEELKKISKNYTINNKPISIVTVDEYSEPENIQVIFIDKTYHKDIDQILHYCQDHRILQVTDQLEKKQYTVVNFVRDLGTDDYGYEVNKKNLLATDLTYEDELFLYGGSLEDLREMYNTTKLLLETETEKVVEMSKEILNKNSELELKNSSIDSLTSQISFKRDTLENLLTTINNQSRSIHNQAKLYKKTNQDLDTILLKYNNQLEAIKNKETKVAVLDSIINQRETMIANQTKTITQKDQTIRAKQKEVLLLILLGSIILLLGLLVYRAYFMKKRNNRILERKVEKRTLQLTATNKDLKQEISRRKKFEVRLIQSERNYREIFDSTTDGICIFNLKGELIDANKATLMMYNYDKKDIFKLSFEDLFFKKGRASSVASNYLIKAIQDQKTEFDSQAKRNNGDVFWIEAAISKTTIADKECILTVIRDIDEKKKNAIELESYRQRLEQMVEERTVELKEANAELYTTNKKLNDLNDDLFKQKQELNSLLEQLKEAQEKLIDSEKMAAIGTIAAGVAHEINNPLNYIKGGVFGIKTIIQDKYTISKEISDLMKGIDEGVDRAATIVSSLNHFSRQGDTLKESCDIHTIINNCLAILQNKTKDIIKITTIFAKDKIVFQGNEGKIHQVILNILTNAVQAIEDEGEILIETGLEINNNILSIKVIDTGIGIKQDLLNKVTTPFFTTKKVGDGTGLGLSISKKIITDHKGVLKISSKENQGTTVLINLPINQYGA